MTVQPHRLALALGPRLLRTTLASWFAGRSGWKVVATAQDSVGTLDLVLEIEPDLLLLGLEVPAMSGLEVVRRIRNLHPRTEIVVLAERHNEAYPPQAFEAGARGYVHGETPPAEVEVALLAARRGDYFLAGEQGRETINDYVGPVVRRQRPGGLITPRERQLACLLADGYSSKEAAGVMNISVKTAETHRASLMRKLGARNVADVVRYCIRNRLIQA
ncbi:MAG: response regulator transcription factor [Acidobacteria bacterium]|nr:response regulator transcription factor [Acidobacteriota bacterium]